MINRRIYNDLVKSLEYFPAIGLIGPRQAGKTTLAKMMIKDMGIPSLYLDMENPSDQQKMENAQLYFEQYSDNMIVLDEIQRCPELFPLLRSLIDKDRRPGRFLILGSASPELKRQSSETLAGRIAYHELGPFTLDEVSDSGGAVNELWLRGGYPESYLASAKEYSILWLQNFVRTHLENDLSAFGLRLPNSLMMRFWTMVAHCNGQLWNASKLAGSLGIDDKTSRRYLDILEDTFMVRQLQPYFGNVKKRLVKSPKTYIRDTGILHNLLRIYSYDDLLVNPALGSSWEGFCIEQILALKPVDYDACFYRTQSGAEIDLVLVKGLNVKLAIEIKFSLTPKLNKTFFAAQDELKPEKSWVIYPGKESYPLGNNVMTLPITEIETKLFS